MVGVLFFSVGGRFAGVFVAGAFLVGACLAGACLAGAFLAGACLAGAFLAGAFLAGDLLAGAGFAGAFVAGAFLAARVDDACFDACLVLAVFAAVAFFSIGSNDLTQYVMAAARDNASVAHLNSLANLGVLRLIALVAKFGREHDIPVSLCGDAGGDPAAIPLLLKAGLRDLSVVPAQLAVAKAAIADVTV